ncbi:conserved hypothethical protein (plasmid) [Ralstonia solanacearum CMR15]|nr:conserved hypothethical protein [Ralstonia solanacearum CMR15]
MATRFQIKDSRHRAPTWVDDYPADAAEQLLSALPPSDVYALIDNAYDTDFAPRLRRRFPDMQPRSLYAGRYEGPGLDEIAPTLMRVPDAPTERCTLLDFLLQETSGKPMLSFLHSRTPAADPLAHLCHQMEAVDHEGVEFLIRLADTNALDAVLQVFDDAQRRRFLSDTQWWYFRRDGSLQRADHATAGVGDAESTPYRCTAAQMQQLEALARPGAMLRFIQTVPHWLGHLVGTPSQAFACIQAALASVDGQVQTHDADVVRQVAHALAEAGLLQSPPQSVNP